MVVASVTPPIGLWTAVLKPRVCILAVAMVVLWKQKWPYMERRVTLRWNLVMPDDHELAVNASNG